MCPSALRWRHNDHAGVSNHQPPGCLLNRLFRRKSKKTSKLRVTGLCAGNSPGTGEFSAQMASYAENVSIWWRHHGMNAKGRVGWNVWVSDKMSELVLVDAKRSYCVLPIADSDKRCIHTATSLFSWIMSNSFVRLTETVSNYESLHIWHTILRISVFGRSVHDFIVNFRLYFKCLSDSAVYEYVIPLII